MGPRPALVGRPAELAALDALLLSVAQGRANGASRWSARRGSGRAGCWPSWATGPTHAACSCCPGLRRSSSRTCRSGRSSTPSTTTSARSHRPDSPTLDDDARSELAHVLPSWPARRPGHVRRLDEDRRYRTHRSVCRLLEVLAGGPPLVLLLDDLHWADSGSVELLCALLRRPPAGPVLLATALRPRQAAARLAGALHRAADSGLLTRVELAGLTLADARRLLGPDVDESLVPALHAESGGNPFYLRQLAQVRRRPGRRRGRAARRRSPDRRRRGPRRRSWPTSTTPPGARWRRRRSPAIPSCWRSPLPPRRCPRPRWPTPSTNCSTATSSARPTPLAGSGSGIRWCAARSTGPRRRAGGSAPTSAARRRWPTAACRSPDGPTTSSRRPASATAAAVGLLRDAGEAVVGRAPGEAARWFSAALDLLPGTATDGRPRPVDGAGRRARRRRPVRRRPRGPAARHRPGSRRVPTPPACGSSRSAPGSSRPSAITTTRTAAWSPRSAALPDLDGAEAVALMGAIAQDRLYRTEYAAAREWSRRAHAAAGQPLPMAESAAGPRARSRVQRGHHRGCDGLLRGRDARGRHVRRGDRGISGSD